ncbi:MAG: hypothetical protein H6Q70_298 [Firmicutes bacterium]|nr:hypothetical protein [Bacillota bacterium]
MFKKHTFYSSQNDKVKNINNLYRSFDREGGFFIPWVMPCYKSMAQILRI